MTRDLTKYLIGAVVALGLMAACGSAPLAPQAATSVWSHQRLAGHQAAQDFLNNLLPTQSLYAKLVMDGDRVVVYFPQAGWKP